MFQDEFRAYLSSFRLNKEFLYSLAVDVLCFLLLGLVAVEAGQWISRTALTVTGGRTSEELQTYILSLPAEQLTALTSQFKTLALGLIAVSVLLPILAVLLFSLCQMVVWHILSKKPFSLQKYWKFVLLVLLSLISLAGVGVIFVLVRLMLAFVVSSGWVAGVVLIILLCAFLILYFLVFSGFVHSLRIGQSIGAAFRNILHRKFLIIFGFGVVTLLLLQVIQYPFEQWLLMRSQLNLAIQVVLFVLWAAWLRSYVILGSGTLPTKHNNV